MDLEPQEHTEAVADCERGAYAYEKRLDNKEVEKPLEVTRTKETALLPYNQLRMQSVFVFSSVVPFWVLSR